MKYLKIIWHHNFNDEPKIIYSEVNEEGWELRKIEIFPDGIYGFADSIDKSGSTELSKEPLPSIVDIANDPQFEPSIIISGDFEEIWSRRMDINKKRDCNSQ